MADKLRRFDIYPSPDLLAALDRRHRSMSAFSEKRCFAHAGAIGDDAPRAVVRSTTGRRLDCPDARG
jgi:hypothetical protein